MVSKKLDTGSRSSRPGYGVLCELRKDLVPAGLKRILRVGADERDRAMEPTTLGTKTEEGVKDGVRRGKPAAWVLGPPPPLLFSSFT